MGLIVKPRTFADRIRKRTYGIILVDAFSAYVTTLASLGILFYLGLAVVFFFPKILPFQIQPVSLFLIFGFLPLLIALLTALFHQSDTRTLTLTLERHYPQLGNRLQTMVELSEKSAQPGTHPFSQALAQGLEAEVNKLMDRFGFGGAISWKRPLAILGVFIFLVLSGAAHAALQPAFFIQGFQRLTQGVEREQWASPAGVLPKFQIEVIPGNCEIAKGTHLLIKARIVDYAPKQVELRIKEKDQPGWRVLPMEQVEGQEYQYVLTHVLETSAYFVQADHQQSSVYKIEIFQPLNLERVFWRMEFPDYMNLPEQRSEGWKDKMTVPRGTKLHLELVTNRPVSSGWISAGNSKRIPLQAETPQKLTVTFIADQDLIVHLDILSKAQEPFQGVPPLWIQTLPDLDPYLEILEPQLQNYVFPTEELPFKININDDYGIRSVVFVIRYQNKEERIDWTPQKDRPVTELVIKPLLELERFNLVSRDFIAAYLEVEDNYPGKPAHVVRSPLFTFVVRDYVEYFKFLKKNSEMPSLRQLFEDVLTEQEKIIQDSWDYLSMSPLEAPKGWENGPGQKSP